MVWVLTLPPCPCYAIQSLENILMPITSSLVKTKNYYLATFVVLCIINAAYQGVFSWYDQEPSAFLIDVSWYWSLIVLIMWMDADSKEHNHRVYRPYEFGFLVFMFWLPYLPYYFWRTRGAIGLAMLGGVASLLFSGYLAQMLIYFAHYSAR